MILIVSKPGDVHAEAVAAEIARFGAESRVLDLSLFPASARLSIAYDGASPRIAYEDSTGVVDAAGAGAVWWRRPQPFGFDDELGGGAAGRFAWNECRDAVEGLWRLLDAAWVNDPVRDEIAHRKVFQLKVAGEAGLEIADTLVTNDPDRARAFLATRAATIYKPFSATEELWRETRLVGAEEMDRLDLVRHAPVILQRYVEGVDIRVSAVAGTLFAAEIDVTRSRYPVDFRMNIMEAAIAPTTLPAAVERGIQAVMDRLGLVYGAFDFRRRPDGSHVFLEVNPAGQWLFVEEATGQPIARALAAHLVREAGRRQPEAVAARRIYSSGRKSGTDR